VVAERKKLIGTKHLDEPTDIAEFPCVRNCCLNDQDICLGCFRSLDEIKFWNKAVNKERIAILENAKHRREAYNLNLSS
jgi:predicted Fe-S protein YdhL (DUF1289 family)